MAKGLSHTQRTLRALREQGILCAVAEKWNPYGGPYGVRQDLFGFIDVIGLAPGRGILAIQVCSGSTFANHYKKLMDSNCTEAVETWLRCGGLIEIWAWRKVKLCRGGKAMIWRPKIHPITLGDVQSTNPHQRVEC